MKITNTADQAFSIPVKGGNLVVLAPGETKTLDIDEHVEQRCQERGFTVQPNDPPKEPPKEPAKEPAATPAPAKAQASASPAPNATTAPTPAKK